MDKRTTSSDFPPRPIGSGGTAEEIFRSAAAESAAAGESEPEEAHPSHPEAASTSLQRRLEQARAPVRLGPYEVHRRIGAGGMGMVYEAIATPRGGRVALKTPLRPAGVGLWRLKNEFRSVQGLDHPNLVTLYELAFEGGEWFFTMEYVEGMSFSEHVQRQGEKGRGEPGTSARRRRSTRTRCRPPRTARCARAAYPPPSGALSPRARSTRRGCAPRSAISPWASRRSTTRGASTAISTGATSSSRARGAWW